MKRVEKVFLPIFLVLAFLAASLAVCNAHTSKTTHPDCPQCVMTSTSRREGPYPISFPVGSHHCPHHACQHLHTPFLIGNVAFLPAFVPSTLTVIDSSSRYLGSALFIFKPPKA